MNPRPITCPCAFWTARRTSFFSIKAASASSPRGWDTMLAKRRQYASDILFGSWERLAASTPSGAQPPWNVHRVRGDRHATYDRRHREGWQICTSTAIMDLFGRMPLMPTAHVRSREIWLHAVASRQQKKWLLTRNLPAYSRGRCEITLQQKRRRADLLEGCVGKLPRLVYSSHRQPHMHTCSAGRGKVGAQ